MKNFLAVAMFCCLTTGCATQTFDMNGRGVVVPDETKMHVFFLGGVGQQHSINAAKICDGVENVAKVESHQRLLDALLSGVTLGIFTPRTAKVYCVK